MSKLRIEYDEDKLNRLVEKLIKAKHLAKETNQLLIEQFILLDEINGRRTDSAKPGTPETPATS